MSDFDPAKAASLGIPLSEEEQSRVPFATKEAILRFAILSGEMSRDEALAFFTTQLTADDVPKEDQPRLAAEMLAALLGEEPGSEGS